MRLGMVGTGLIVQAQLEQMGHRPGYSVGAISGTPRSSAKTAELAERYHIPERYDDFLEMVAMSDIDTVYVGVPNSLHSAVTRAALGAGKNVICEKPLTPTYDEAETLSYLAREQGLFLWEAITIPYLPNFSRLQALLPRIGMVKMACCNFSQYSRRYDRFRAGETPAAFDPARAGGALMDLGVYNLHYLVGLFGAPDAVSYAANVERGIDTSGVVTLDYGDLKAVSVAAKDCAAPSYCIIQGTAGYLAQYTKSGECGPITLHLNDGTDETYDDNGFIDPARRWDAEFAGFAADVANGSLDHCYEMLDQSLIVARVIEEARRSAGVVFPADRA